MRNDIIDVTGLEGFRFFTAGPKLRQCSDGRGMVPAFPLSWGRGAIHFDDGSSVEYSRSDREFRCFRESLSPVRPVRRRGVICRAEEVISSHEKERLVKTFGALLEAWHAVYERDDIRVDDFAGINGAMFELLRGAA